MTEIDILFTKITPTLLGAIHRGLPTYTYWQGVPPGTKWQFQSL